MFVLAKHSNFLAIMHSNCEKNRDVQWRGQFLLSKIVGHIEKKKVDELNDIVVLASFVSLLDGTLKVINKKVNKLVLPPAIQDLIKS
jgi:hypothetical protein